MERSFSVPIFPRISSISSSRSTGTRTRIDVPSARWIQPPSSFTRSPARFTASAAFFTLTSMPAERTNLRLCRMAAALMAKGTLAIVAKEAAPSIVDSSALSS